MKVVRIRAEDRPAFQHRLAEFERDFTYRLGSTDSSQLGGASSSRTRG